MGSEERARLPLVLDVLREIDWETQLSDPSGDTSRLSFVSGLLLGLVFGTLVALALAPQPGRRTRQQVWETGIELRARAPHRRPPAAEETLAEEGAQAEIDVRRRLTANETI
jgi:gas vesicle protein